MEWTEIISLWLKEGEDGAEMLLDYPWDIEVKPVEGPIEREVVVATHPKIPFNVEVVVSKHFTNLVINPVIPSDALPAEDRMRLYKKLLHLNTDLNLMKAGLVGYDDTPIIQVDLDLESISKKEFNDALTLLIVGAQNLINILGITDKVQIFMVERFKQFIALKLSSGETEEDILDFLTDRGGLEKDVAKELYDQVTRILKEEGEEKTDPEAQPVDYDGPMYG